MTPPAGTPASQPRPDLATLARMLSEILAGQEDLAEVAGRLGAAVVRVEGLVARTAALVEEAEQRRLAEERRRDEETKASALAERLAKAAEATGAHAAQKALEDAGAKRTASGTLRLSLPGPAPSVPDPEEAKVQREDRSFTRRWWLGLIASIVTIAVTAAASYYAGKAPASAPSPAPAAPH